MGRADGEYRAVAFNFRKGHLVGLLLHGGRNRMRTGPASCRLTYSAPRIDPDHNSRNRSGGYCRPARVTGCLFILQSEISSALRPKPQTHGQNSPIMTELPL